MAAWLKLAETFEGVAKVQDLLKKFVKRVSFDTKAILSGDAKEAKVEISKLGEVFDAFDDNQVVIDFEVERQTESTSENTYT